MDVYVYNAALYCEQCGEAIKADLQYIHEGKPEEDFDSGEYPKGPYSNGGGESDVPEHCAGCKVHLENPLTGDGVRYLRGILARAGNPDVIIEWTLFYADILDLDTD